MVKFALNLWLWVYKNSFYINLNLLRVPLFSPKVNEDTPNFKYWLGLRGQ